MDERHYKILKHGNMILQLFKFWRYDCKSVETSMGKWIFPLILFFLYIYKHKYSSFNCLNFCELFGFHMLIINYFVWLFNNFFLKYIYIYIYIYMLVLQFFTTHWYVSISYKIVTRVVSVALLYTYLIYNWIMLHVTIVFPMCPSKNLYGF
jgi:hypothetical protein